MSRAPTFQLPDVRPVEGLGLDTHEVTWLGRSAAHTLVEQATAAGLPVADSEDVVTLSAGAVATAEALRRFVRATQDVQGDVIGTLTAPYDRWSSEPAFGPPVTLQRRRGGGAWSEARFDGATRVQVPVEGQRFEVPLLDAAGGRVEAVDASMAFAISLVGWPGVVWANLLGLGPALIEVLPGARVMAPLRLALAAARAGSTEPEAVGRQLVRRERGVRVHPSAVVEGCWLQEGATVDAGAVLRHCIIGPGATVEPQALAIGTVLGPGARLQRRGFATYSVLDRDAVVGGTLQLGLVGAHAQVKINGILLDQALGGPVQALFDGQKVPAPLGLLGAALGTHAMVGAGVQVAAGRCIPPGVQVVASEHDVLVRVGSESAGRYRVAAGRLEPC